tara:strand:- start:86 stop:523 length:438 start_codon:yes stop_codon:yes gene_type:complete
MTNKFGILLIPVEPKKEHIEVLYNLLKERIHNISHKKLPEFNEHKLFVLNHPYRKWFLVKSNNIYIGSIYILENNCMGININSDDLDVIKKCIQCILSSVKPLPGIKSLRNENFNVNISPDNKKMCKLLNELNAKLIEHTYIIKQ